MIAIINYGMGNTGSLQNMIRRVGGESEITSDISAIAAASKLILPGVGSFDNGMRRLRESGIADILNRRVCEEQVPILCICLGMQMVTNNSEEGILPGLGWINATTVRFRFSDEPKLRVPHMGWNTVTINKELPLMKDLPEDPKFYFVHSYYVRCSRKEDIMATTTYGDEFVSAIQKNNIYATQFHPEKSHKFGMRLMSNFINL